MFLKYEYVPLHFQWAPQFRKLANFVMPRQQRPRSLSPLLTVTHPRIQENSLIKDKSYFVNY